MGFRPEFLVVVFVEVGDFLDGRPSQDSVVADEGRYITVGDGVTNGCIDEVREECDAVRRSALTISIDHLRCLPVLKVRVHDLHDA